MNLKRLSRQAAQYLHPKFVLGKAKSTYYHYKRVLKRTRKPTKEEFVEVVKISAAGMLVMGLIGFIIQTIFIYIIKV